MCVCVCAWLTNRDPVADDSIREGMAARFQLPIPYPYHAALDFGADQVTNETLKRMAETVTSMGFDVGLAKDRGLYRQDVDLFASTGLRFTDPNNLRPSAGSSFSRVQIMATGVRRALFNREWGQLATRHLGFWSTKSVPEYLAYRIGGRFYVRGFDEPDFHPFTAIFGGTTEIRIPLSFSNLIRVRPSPEDEEDEESNQLVPTTRPPPPPPTRRSLPLEGVAFVDYAIAGDLPMSGGARTSREYISVGVGLRFGPIKVDYAVNHRREARVHMSLVDPTF